MKRAQNKLRRVLMLIDALAPLRMPFTVNEALDRLKARSGGTFAVCHRTVQRDIELLVSLDFASVFRKGTKGHKSEATTYKMNLAMTTAAEFAAIKASEGKP